VTDNNSDLASIYHRHTGSYTKPQWCKFRPQRGACQALQMMDQLTDKYDCSVSILLAS